MTKKTEVEAEAEPLVAEVVVKNMTAQPLSIGGVNLPPSGGAVIDNWDVVKKSHVVMVWLEAGVIAV